LILLASVKLKLMLIRGLLV